MYQLPFVKIDPIELPFEMDEDDLFPVLLLLLHTPNMSRKEDVVRDSMYIEGKAKGIDEKMNIFQRFQLARKMIENI